MLVPWLSVSGPEKENCRPWVVPGSTPMSFVVERSTRSSNETQPLLEVPERHVHPVTALPTRCWCSASLRPDLRVLVRRLLKSDNPRAERSPSRPAAPGHVSGMANSPHGVLAPSAGRPTRETTWTSRVLKRIAVVAVAIAAATALLMTQVGDSSNQEPGTPRRASTDCRETPPSAPDESRLDPSPIPPAPEQLCLQLTE